MNGKYLNKNKLWCLTVLLLSGCAFPSFGEPAQIQVPATQSIEILGTSIIQTAEAAQTQTVTSVPPTTPTHTPTPSLVPTITFTPTPTFVFSLYTATPIVIVTETSIVPISEGGGAGTSSDGYILTGKEWTCTVTFKSPGKGAVIAMGKTFYVYWTVINTGTKTWTNNGVDFVYSGGLRMNGRRIQDLPLNVAPGNKVTFKIEVTAPEREDTYSTIWTLKVGRRDFCGMKVTFDVK